MRYLITGGAGFVGANLVRRCVSEPGAEVTVLDSLDPRFHSSVASLAAVRERITLVEADIRDDKMLSEVVRGQEIVIHCAAQTSHPLSMEEPLRDAEINCLGSLTLLEALRRHNPAASVVFASTTTVVGRATAVVDEAHPERPLDIYSANHGVAEKYALIYHHAHGLRTVSLRLPNLYGPLGKHDPQFGFINFFIAQALDDQELPIYGDGQQRRNVLYVDDAIEALLLAAHDPHLAGQILIAASDEHLRVRQIAEEIVRAFGRGRVRHVEWPADRQRLEIGDVALSSARLRTLTGWKPRFSFESGLRRTLEIMHDLRDQPTR